MKEIKCDFCQNYLTYSESFCSELKLTFKSPLIYNKVENTTKDAHIGFHVKMECHFCNFRCLKQWIEYGT